MARGLTTPFFYYFSPLLSLIICWDCTKMSQSRGRRVRQPSSNGTIVEPQTPPNPWNSRKPGREQRGGPAGRHRPGLGPRPSRCRTAGGEAGAPIPRGRSLIPHFWPKRRPPTAPARFLSPDPGRVSKVSLGLEQRLLSQGHRMFGAISINRPSHALAGTGQH